MPSKKKRNKTARVAKAKKAKAHREQRARKRANTAEINYTRRLISVQSLGFEDYADYLRSELWAGIRRRVFERDKMRCRLCNGRAAQVHHHRYDKATILGETLDYMAALCRSCHRYIEYDETGRKRSLREVGELYRRLRRSLKSSLHFGVNLGEEWEPDLVDEFRAIVRDEASA